MIVSIKITTGGGVGAFAPLKPKNKWSQDQDDL
jgi:hypothetical protein